MSYQVKYPSVGESIVEGVLSKWLKADGSYVQVDEPLFEVETDKISQEIVALVAGVLKVLVPEGETVKIGAVIGEIDTTAAAPATQSPAPPAEPIPAVDASPAAGVTAGSGKTSPSVRRLASENQLDLSQVEGSGPGGRITKGDAQSAIASKTPATSQPAPAASKPPAPVPDTAKPAAAPAAASGRSEERQPMSRLRRRIAERLVSVTQTTAMLTTFNEMDMSRVIALRKQYKQAFIERHGVKLGFMSFFVKAAVRALQDFPLINSRLEDDLVVSPNYIDIGIAVGTDRGLMVPVLRDVQAMSFADVESSIVSYARKARERKIQLSELTGGTFTVTNGGTYGSLMSTPILNPPQSGILGMHKIEPRPVAIEGKVEIRPMMYVALSYDHRIVDGKEAVGFLVTIKNCVENPERLLLEV